MVGTVFMQSHVPLQEWFLAVLLSAPQGKGITSLRLAEYVDVTQKTAWSMLRRIRYGLRHEEGDDVGIRKLEAESFGVDSAFDEAMRKLVAVSLSADAHV